MQNIEYIYHQDVQIYCTTNQFTQLELFGTNNKQHGALVLVKHYCMCFDPKLRDGTCEIRRIPCAFTQCTYMLDKTWATCVPPQQQPFYQPVKYFTYWTMLGFFNNWNTIHFHIRQHPVNKLTKLKSS